MKKWWNRLFLGESFIPLTVRFRDSQVWSFDFESIKIIFNYGSQQEESVCL